MQNYSLFLQGKRAQKSTIDWVYQILSWLATGCHAIKNCTVIEIDLAGPSIPLPFLQLCWLLSFSKSQSLPNWHFGQFERARFVGQAYSNTEKADFYDLAKGFNITKHVCYPRKKIALEIWSAVTSVTLFFFLGAQIIWLVSSLFLFFCSCFFLFPFITILSIYDKSFVLCLGTKLIF